MTISPSPDTLEAVLYNRNQFSLLDHYFARFIGRLSHRNREAATLAAALVSRAGGAGHTCLDLDSYGGRPLINDSGNPEAATLICPETSIWRELLLQSGVAGPGKETTPLVLSGNRLYLHRFWQDEKSIVCFIRERGKQRRGGRDFGRIRHDLHRFFPKAPGKNTDWQRVAAIAALTGSFTVISGGPGTGKTTTAAKILALFVGQHQGKGQPRILLGAPTGKAAARLQETISTSNLLPAGTPSLKGATLHRLLGPLPDSAGFRHSRSNPLAADIILIDEASMVDLVLMARLMEAVPASARLILLGDHHQLASVQPGSVLADICQPAAMRNFSAAFRHQLAELCPNLLPPAPGREEKGAGHGLEDCFVELLETYRFEPKSAISRLSTAIRKGDGQGTLAVLHAPGDRSVSWCDIPDGTTLAAKLHQAGIVNRYAAAAPDPDPDSCFDALSDCRILAVMRLGPYGTERLNRLLEEQLLQDARQGKGVFWRPLLISRNDYSLNLFNGDVGIFQPDPVGSETGHVFFHAGGGSLRNVALPLLPRHETAFAMTVHKGQGSEFKRVILVLPERDSDLLSRELLYTAVTRARETVEIWGRRELLVTAVARQTSRNSGLASALWGLAPGTPQNSAGMVPASPK